MNAGSPTMVGAQSVRTDEIPEEGLVRPDRSRPARLGLVAIGLPVVVLAAVTVYENNALSAPFWVSWVLVAFETLLAILVVRIFVASSSNLGIVLGAEKIIYYVQSAKPGWALQREVPWKELQGAEATRCLSRRVRSLPSSVVRNSTPTVWEGS